MLLHVEDKNRLHSQPWSSVGRHYTWPTRSKSVIVSKSVLKEPILSSHSLRDILSGKIRLLMAVFWRLLWNVMVYSIYLKSSNSELGRTSHSSWQRSIRRKDMDAFIAVVVRITQYNSKLCDSLHLKATGPRVYLMTWKTDKVCYSVLRYSEVILDCYRSFQCKIPSSGGLSDEVDGWEPSNLSWNAPYVLLEGSILMFSVNCLWTVFLPPMSKHNYPGFAWSDVWV